MGSRRAWLRIGMALWIVGVSLLQVLPVAVASVPPLDCEAPCLMATDGPLGPGAAMDETEVISTFPLGRPLAELLCPDSAPMAPTPVRSLLPPP
jgi:hypothetical protein